MAPSSDEYINLLKWISLRWGRILVVINALDESAEPSNFIQKLHELTVSTAVVSTTIQVLVTSREDLSLEREFQPLCTSDISLMENMGTDISQYITSEVKFRMARGLLKLRNRSLADRIIPELEEQAEGM